MEEIAQDFPVENQDKAASHQTIPSQIEQLEFLTQQNSPPQQQNVLLQLQEQQTYPEPCNTKSDQSQTHNEIDQHITEPQAYLEDYTQNIPLQQTFQSKEELALKFDTASQVLEFIIAKAIKLSNISKKFEKSKIENIFKNLLDDPNQSVYNEQAATKLIQKGNLEPDIQPKSNIFLQGCSAQMKLKLMRGQIKQFVLTGFESSKEASFIKIKNQIANSLKKQGQTSKLINSSHSTVIQNKTQTQRQWKENKKKIKKVAIQRTMQRKEKIENGKMPSNIISLLNQVKLAEDDEIGALRAIKQEQMNRKRGLVKSVLPSIHKKSKQVDSKWRQQHSSSVNYSSNVGLESKMKGRKGGKISQIEEQSLIAIKQNKPELNFISVDFAIQQSEKLSSLNNQKGKIRKKDSTLNRNKSLQSKLDFGIVQIIENKKTSLYMQQIRGKQNQKGELPSLESKPLNAKTSLYVTKKASDWRRIKNESKQFQQKLNSFLKSRHFMGSIHLMESEYNRMELTEEKRIQYQQKIENK